MAIRASSWWVVTGLVLVGAALARGDTVELKDGSTVRGEIVSSENGRVRLRIRLKSGAEATLTLEKKDVKAVRFDEPSQEDGASDADEDPLGGAAGKRVGRTKERAKGEGGPTLSPDNEAGRRTIYLLDHSGSMAIGERWEQAVKQTERLIQRLDLGAPFDVMVFSAHVRSLFTKDNTSFRSKTSAERVAAALRADPPEKRSGTNFVRALRRAVERNPKKIVLITDGVGTLGGPFASEDALSAVTAARDKGIPVDVLAAQDGTYELRPSVEDLGAARQFLERIARTGGGVFLPLPNVTKAPEKLPDAFRPEADTPDGTRDRVEFEILDVRERKRFRSGQLPSQFKVRVLDPVLTRLQTPDVWEYGGSALIEIQLRGGEKRQLRLELEEGWLVTQQLVQITGKSKPGGIVRPERVLVSSVERIVYHRGSKSFPLPFAPSHRERSPCEDTWTLPWTPQSPPRSEVARRSSRILDEGLVARDMAPRPKILGSAD